MKAFIIAQLLLTCCQSHRIPAMSIQSLLDESSDVEGANDSDNDRTKNSILYDDDIVNDNDILYKNDILDVNDILDESSVLYLANNNSILIDFGRLDNNDSDHIESLYDNNQLSDNDRLDDLLDDKDRLDNYRLDDLDRLDLLNHLYSVDQQAINRREKQKEARDLFQTILVKKEAREMFLDFLENNNDVGEVDRERDDRALANSFPFNQVLDIRVMLPFAVKSLQGSSEISFDEVAAAGTGKDGGGKRCIEKVIMEEEIIWDEYEECNHSYNNRCFTSFSTSFEAVQEEECGENFLKNCFITYSQAAINETVQICRTPLVKDCNKLGEETCSTQYESECITKQERHEVEDDVPDCSIVFEESCEEVNSGYTSNEKCTAWPKEVCSLSTEKRTKFSPITTCEKVPVTLCGPAGCGFTEGEEECMEKVQTIVMEKPEESCNLDPQRSCKHVTRLVPLLRETENCVDIPNEICVKSQRNPRKIRKPIIKNWCYGQPKNAATETVQPNASSRLRRAIVPRNVKLFKETQAAVLPPSQQNAPIEDHLSPHPAQLKEWKSVPTFPAAAQNILMSYLGPLILRRQKVEVVKVP